MSGSRLRAVAAGVAALATVAAVLTATPAAARPSEIPDMPAHCRSAYRTAVQWNADVSKVATRRVVTFDGIRVRLTPNGWSVRNAKDGAWSLWFHSLAWTVPLAMDDPKTAVDVVLERDAALPDPGVGAERTYLQRTGWTQGMFRTRLETVTCLWRLTGDARLRPVAERLAAANMDPDRYPGPPNYLPHNHGTMSNIALTQAGRQFGVKAWIDAALRRIETDLPLVFDPCGMMHEQSSTYQHHNVRLWTKAAGMVGVELDEPVRALGALVRPDGVLEAIGDGTPEPNLTPNGRTLWCADLGWAAGTVGGSHYTLRFGPPKSYHGHLDHGSLTWFAAGVPVLSDRGLYDKGAGSRRDYATGMSAHSVLEPIGFPSLNPRTRASRSSGHRFALTSDTQGVERERRIRVETLRLTVEDRASGAEGYVQHWQLAPGWKPVKGGAVHSSGATLTVDCPKLKPVKVESFTAWRTAESAWDLQCRFPTPTVAATTTLTVTPP